jgi:hypothetical protein
VTVHSILPGMTFETKVAAKGVKHGLRLNFGDLTGYVHHHHVDKVKKVLLHKSKFWHSEVPLRLNIFLRFTVLKQCFSTLGSSALIFGSPNCVLFCFVGCQLQNVENHWS